uniref:CD72 molecule n=1 Tax=Equus asinus asinus TaxID=83772 RepID=A0A8C4M8L3_EQUAS
MAEAITYADLRFVKAPLKKGIARRLGQDPEADEDGELTYENVQVPPVPGGSSSASSGLGDKAGVQSEPPPAVRSSATPPAAGRPLRGECRALPPRARASPAARGLPARPPAFPARGPRGPGLGRSEPGLRPLDRAGGPGPLLCPFTRSRIDLSDVSPQTPSPP